MRSTLTIALGLGFFAASAFGQASQPAGGLSREQQMRAAAATRPAPDAAARSGRGGGRATSQPIDPAAIAQFVAIETIARIPVNQRGPQIVKLYREMTPPMMNPFADGSYSSLPADLFDRNGGSVVPMDPNTTLMYLSQLDSVIPTLTAQQVGEKINSAHGASILRTATRRRALGIFNQNMDDLRPLLRDDLNSNNFADATRAANVIHTMALKEFAEQAMTLYLAGGPNTQAAMSAISWITGDPELARRLLDDVEKHPEALSRHYLLISGMLRNQPIDARFAPWLDATDADTRYYAAICISECAPADRAGFLIKLLSDQDLQIKLQAVKSAFQLPEKDYPLTRPALVPLLRDPDDRVRLEVADGLAGKRDIVAAQVLLDFLRDPRPPRSSYMSLTRVSTTAPAAAERRDELRVLMAIGRLMDSRGRRLSYNTAKWGPDDPQNAAAVNEFERWIAQNAKP